MPRIELSIEIAAPVELVFDLARNIDVHQVSQSKHKERAVAGRTSGLIEEGEVVTWEAIHFGFVQQLTSRIAMMHRPDHFRDVMVSGAFRRFEHDHFFEAVSSRSTLVRDVFDYTSPLGLLGRIADVLFLERYMRNLLAGRNVVLKQLAEQPPQ
jgi:ligand-binding SRPBCC domain-containing protein